MIEIAVIRAFTGPEAKGNAAGVCLQEAPLSDRQMQRIAAQMGLSETAFLAPMEQGVFSLRWFTPSCEVDLCGHATLASAAFLAHRRQAFQQTFAFQTRSGLLHASVDEPFRASLVFPVDSPQKIAAPDGLARMLGSQDIREFYRGNLYGMAVVENEDVVRCLNPDMDRLAQTFRGLIVTAKANPGCGYDVVSRCFAPACGIPEDPATGSAQCLIYPCWSEKLGKKKLISFQASAEGGWFELQDQGKKELAIRGGYAFDEVRSVTAD